MEQETLAEQAPVLQAGLTKYLQMKEAIKLMCRIIVSGSGVEVGEEQLKTMFGPFGPLKSVSMSQNHKGQDITLLT